MPTGLRATILVTQAAALKALWRCNETTGNLADSSGNSKTLTASVAPTYTQGGPCGQSVAFNGSSQYCSRTDSVLGTTAPAGWTMCCVVKGAAQDGRHLLSLRSSTGNGQISLISGFSGYGQATSSLALLVTKDDGTDIIGTVVGESVTNVFDGSWHIIIARYNGTNFTVYKDSATASITKAVAQGTISLDRSAIGGYLAGSAGGFKSSNLELVGWWNAALTDTEIAALVASWTTCAVYADGTGDYTTAQAWATAIAGVTDAREAEVRGDVGGFDLTGGWTLSSTRIYAAPGYGPQLNLTGAKTGVGTVGSALGVKNFTWENVWLNGHDILFGTDWITGDYWRVKNCVCDGQMSYEIGNANAGATIEISVIDTAINTSSLDVQVVIDTDPSMTVNVNIYNCFVKNNAFFYEDIGASTTCTLNLDIKNTEMGTFDPQITRGTITAANNLTADGTADDFGGTGHQVNKTLATQVFNTSSNWKLRRNSACRNAGRGNAAVTQDALGARRSLQGVIDIGPHEFIDRCGLIRMRPATARPRRMRRGF